MAWGKCSSCILWYIHLVCELCSKNVNALAWCTKPMAMQYILAAFYSVCIYVHTLLQQNNAFMYYAKQNPVQYFLATFYDDCSTVCILLLEDNVLKFCAKPNGSVACPSCLLRFMHYSVYFVAIGQCTYVLHKANARQFQLHFTVYVLVCALCSKRRMYLHIAES